MKDIRRQAERSNETDETNERSPREDKLFPFNLYNYTDECKTVISISD